MVRISIWVTNPTNAPSLITPSMPLADFRAVSELRVSKSGIVMLSHDSADVDAARRICAWIAGLDPFVNLDRQGMSIDSMGVETFEGVVALLFTANALRITRRAYIKDVREAIYHYLRAGPLSLSEFQMVCEMLGRDRGLVKAAMGNVMSARLTALGAPEGGLIESWCVKNGLWERMVQVGTEIGTQLNGGEMVEGGEIRQMAEGEIIKEYRRCARALSEGGMQGDEDQRRLSAKQEGRSGSVP